jgi:hypothetical protein
MIGFLLDVEYFQYWFEQVLVTISANTMEVLKAWYCEPKQMRIVVISKFIPPFTRVDSWMFNVTCSNFKCMCKTIFTNNCKMACTLLFRWSIIIKYMKLNLSMYIYAKDIRGPRKENDCFWLAIHGNWPRTLLLNYPFFHVNGWRRGKVKVVLTYCGSFNIVLVSVNSHIYVE